LSSSTIQKGHNKVLLELKDDPKNSEDSMIVSVEEEKMLNNIEEGQTNLVWYDYIKESDPAKTRGLKKLTFLLRMDNKTK
jgi:hypothetical protein